MNMITITLADAPSSSKHITETLQVTQDATIQKVLTQSQLCKTHPEILNAPVGVFGKRASNEHRVSAGERIEVYRALTLDPMKQRIKRLKSKSSF